MKEKSPNNHGEVKEFNVKESEQIVDGKITSYTQYSAVFDDDTLIDVADMVFKAGRINTFKDYATVGIRYKIIAFMRDRANSEEIANARDYLINSLYYKPDEKTAAYFKEALHELYGEER